MARRLLTTAQRAALIDYAAETGPRWKQELAIDWEHARASIGGHVSPELQQVRNQFGPGWLHRTTLKQIKSAPTSDGGGGSNLAIGRKEMRLGAIEKFGRSEPGEVPSAQITYEHGVYIVRGFNAEGKHIVEGFRTLVEARRLAQRITSNGGGANRTHRYTLAHAGRTVRRARTRAAAHRATRTRRHFGASVNRVETLSTDYGSKFRRGDHVFAMTGAAWKGSSFKRGYYYVNGVDMRGGAHLVDLDRDSLPGEPAYALSKDKEMRGGAVWFSESSLRRVKSRLSSNRAGKRSSENVNGLTFSEWLDAAGGTAHVDSVIKNGMTSFKAWQRGEDPSEYRAAGKYGVGREMSALSPMAAPTGRPSRNRAGAPPGPPIFGQEKTASDIRARIEWERWMADDLRRRGDPSSEILARGHDQARAGYEDLLAHPGPRQRSSNRASLPRPPGWSQWR